MFVLIDLYICVLPYENTVVEDERLEGNSFNHEVKSWIQDTMLLDAKGGQIKLQVFKCTKYKPSFFIYIECSMYKCEYEHQVPLDFI